MDLTPLVLQFVEEERPEASLCLESLPPQALINQTDTREHVEETQSFPWNNVCFVEADFTGGAKQVGTAFLTNLEIVWDGTRYVIALTAAHVLCYYKVINFRARTIRGRSQDAMATFVRLRAGLDKDGSNSNWFEVKLPRAGERSGWFSVSNGWLNPELKNYWEHDYGVIFIASDKLPFTLQDSSKRIKLYDGDIRSELSHLVSTQQPPLTGAAPFVVAGYPTDKDRGTMWKSFGRFECCQQNPKSQQGQLLKHHMDTFAGQSGSPVLFNVGPHKHKAMAIHNKGKPAEGGIQAFNVALIITEDIRRRVQKGTANNTRLPELNLHGANSGLSGAGGVGSPGLSGGGGQYESGIFPIADTAEPDEDAQPYAHRQPRSTYARSEITSSTSVPTVPAPPPSSFPAAALPPGGLLGPGFFDLSNSIGSAESSARFLDRSSQLRQPPAGHSSPVENRSAHPESSEIGPPWNSLELKRVLPNVISRVHALGVADLLARNSHFPDDQLACLRQLPSVEQQGQKLLETIQRRGWPSFVAFCEALSQYSQESLALRLEDAVRHLPRDGQPQRTPLAQSRQEEIAAAANQRAPRQQPTQQKLVLTELNIYTCPELLSFYEVVAASACLRDRARWQSLAAELGFDFDDIDNFVDRGQNEGLRAQEMLKCAVAEKNLTIKRLMEASKAIRIQESMKRALLKGST